MTREGLTCGKTPLNSPAPSGVVTSTVLGRNGRGVFPQPLELFRRVTLLACVFSSSVLADAQVTLCNTANQSGAGTNLATAISRGGTITFRCPSSPATIRITTPLAVSRSVRIDGGQSVTLSGGGSSGLFRASGNVDLALERIVLRDANAAGGTPLDPNRAIDGFRSLRMETVTVRDVTLAFRTRVGGRFDARDLYVQNGRGSLVTASTLELDRVDVANHQGRVFETFEPGSGARGTIRMRAVRVDGGVGSQFRHCEELAIADSTFASGKARYFRGDTVPLILLFDLAGAVDTRCQINRISHTRFVNNQGTHSALFLGGATTTTDLRNVTFEGNAGRHGALSILPGASGTATVNLRNVIFNDNDAWLGGAIHSTTVAPPTIRGMNVTFHGNRSDTRGGAVFAPGATLTLGSALVTDNRADLGPSAFDLQDDGGRSMLTLVNSLIARNQSGSTAAIATSQAHVVHSTIADNSAGGIAATRLSIIGSVLHNNSAFNCQPSPNASIEGTTSFQFPHTDCGNSIIRADPLLDGIYVPAPDSPLYQAASLEPCTTGLVQSRDLVGERRPRYGDRCTAGAIEGELSRWLVRHQGTQLEKAIRSCEGNLDCLRRMAGIEK